MPGVVPPLLILTHEVTLDTSKATEEPALRSCSLFIPLGKFTGKPAELVLFQQAKFMGFLSVSSLKQADLTRV